MFIILLRFAHNKDMAAEFMQGHGEWIENGFNDGVFLAAGGLQAGAGGAVVAHNTTAEDLQARVNRDPFVAAEVVTADILEMTPSRVDERLQFLLG